ncbi:MAG TPA: alpha-amylase family glycosyl hydrolase [Candidatus Paceibacterota bacterium]|nr:alpha-amylase family glycosyl hydrolase [Verrucomicrobiota bacterium]HSA11317.1 alpha-amylase family glycosyl hydrolase [Candidatus Paceibacterota bacterium]
MKRTAKFWPGAVGASLNFALTLLALAARADQTPEFWQSQSIYHVVTDRFFDGDSSNNNAEGSYNPGGSSGTSVHGGDFKGLEQKLDYIKSLGATAIWISPIVLNANGEFHGYAGRDFYQVGPHWGTLADLQQFTAAAHARGLLVINDVIVNHGGDLIGSSEGNYFNSFKTPPAGYNLRHWSSKQYPAPFNTNAANPNLTDLFHNNGLIHDYGNQDQAELGELSGLDDFNTESDYVRARMVEIYRYWIGQAGFDGFRVDTVKHVEMGFWQTWCPAIHAWAATNGKPNFFMFGEILDGSNAKCGSYTGTQGGGPFKLDSVLDYPLYFAVNNVFATASGSTSQIESRYAALAANYDASARNRLVTFLDNHDQERFLSSGKANNNTERLKVALAFLYTARGIPCLYYGTEQAFNGGNDPYDREDMFDGQFEQGPSLGDNFNMAHPLFQWVARLNNFRRLYPALLTGSHVNLWNDPDGPGLFAYARRLGTQEVLVVLNTATSSQTLPARSTVYPAGTTLVNLLDTNETTTVTAGPQTPSISVPGMSAKLFLAESQWALLDPVVTSITPAHDSTDAATVAPVVIRFSQPMSTGSVVSAFSTLPAVSGAFSWSSANDTLTFTPAGAGFPAQTFVTVRLAATAQGAESGKAFHAGFEARYRTGTSTYIDLTPPTVLIQTPTNESLVGGNLTVTGTAADNFAVQKVEVRLDTNAWVLASGTNTWSCLLSTSNFLNGSHLLAVRAADSSGNISATNSVNVRFLNVPGDYLQRISGGNSSNVTDCAGNVWMRDQAYSVGSCGHLGGTTGVLVNTISGVCAAAQSLYQRERYSTSSEGFYYQFDCPVGTYEVTMLEAETYWSSAGQRVFDAYIQGRQVLTDFDIYATAGGMNLPLTLVFTNAVTNAQLKVLFTPVVDNARVSGIQVRKLADLYSGNDSIPDWWRLAFFDHAIGQAEDFSRAGDDADGDGLSNLAEFVAGTNPRDDTSSFKITGFVQAAGEAQLAWTARAGRTYQLLQSDGLGESATWSNFGAALAGVDGVLTQAVGAATGASRFFRVQVR